MQKCIAHSLSETVLAERALCDVVFQQESCSLVDRWPHNVWYPQVPFHSLQWQVITNKPGSASWVWLQPTDCPVRVLLHCTRAFPRKGGVLHLSCSQPSAEALSPLLPKTTPLQMKHRGDGKPVSNTKCKLRRGESGVPPTSEFAQFALYRILLFKKRFDLTLWATKTLQVESNMLILC